MFSLETLIIGLLTGLLSGTFGVGGGIVCTPLLRLWLHYSAHEAVGTTLALIVPTSLAGAVSYAKQGKCHYALVARFSLPAILACIIAAHLTVYVQGSTLMLAFAALIALAAVDLIFSFSERLKSSAKKGEIEANTETTKVRINLFSSIAIGFLVGTLSGFFGVGGGFILIPILLALYRMPVKQAFGTSLLLVSVVSIPGTISHFQHSHVKLDSAMLMALSAIPGSLIGSRIALNMKDVFLKKGFGLIMLLVSAFMAFKEFTGP